MQLMRAQTAEGLPGADALSKTVQIILSDLYALQCFAAARTTGISFDEAAVAAFGKTLRGELHSQIHQSKRNILDFAKGSQAECMERFAHQCGRTLSEQVMATLFAAYQVASRLGVNLSTRSARAASRTRSRPAKARDIFRRLDESLAAYEVAAAASAGIRAASSFNMDDLRYLGEPRQVHLLQAIGQAPTASAFSATRTRSC